MLRQKEKRRGQSIRSTASVKINTIFYHQRTKALNINTSRQSTSTTVCVEMCVCMHVLNRRLHLILKWVKQENAVYNRKTSTQPNHVHQTKNPYSHSRTGTQARVWTVLFTGAQRINCLHFPSPTAASFMSSPCFCFFTCHLSDWSPWLLKLLHLSFSLLPVTSLLHSDPSNSHTCILSCLDSP